MKKIHDSCVEARLRLVSAMEARTAGLAVRKVGSAMAAASTSLALASTSGGALAPVAPASSGNDVMASATAVAPGASVKRGVPG
jgi:hypothetical protein